MDVTYVLPIRCSSDHGPHDELTAYLATIAALGAEVVVVDNSDDGAFADHRAGFDERVRHLAPTRSTTNGKVGNVLTGIDVASNELVVIADDDVRHDDATLRALASRLHDADVVVPANVFAPMPWHARWDTGRTLLNRSFWTDYPGTLAVRRSTLVATGGYDGDVLFENLELMRTVRARGGRVVPAPDVIVARRPPSTRTFLGQRVRQAYDDLAQPAKLVAMLALAPLSALAVSRRAWRALGAGIALAVGLAEIGRRRDGGGDVFEPTAALWAPAWLAERAICIWIAVGRRIVLGGVRYRGTRLRRAATPMRELRRRAGAGQPEVADRGRARAAA
jgi:glycosyltransferase involved in cell wall biosynthesis